ncbi:MAG: hypothetical protein ACO3E4_06900, partial [Candidatus Nanopelagicaceae bacterium]
MSVYRVQNNTDLSLKGTNTVANATTLLAESVYYVDAKEGTNYIPTTASGYMYLPGIAQNRATTPDAAALDITGDIDIRVKVAMDKWIPSTTMSLVGKWSGFSNQLSYVFTLRSNGTLGFAWTPTGPYNANLDRSSTTIVPFSDGSIGWVRATLDVNNGSSNYDLKFFTSNDGTTWTQLGDTLNGSATTSIYSSSALLEIGTNDAGAASPARGKFYRAQVRNG